MGIQLIALDLDGTLLNSAKQVSPRTLQALQKAASMGVVIVPSTGRSFDGIPSIIADLPFVQYALTLNGAVVVNIRTKEIIHQCNFNKEEALFLWSYLQKYDALCDCAIDGELYMEQQTFLRLPDYGQTQERIALMRSTRKEAYSIREMLLQENTKTAKMNLLFSNLRKRLNAKFELEQIHFVEVSSSLEKNLELNKKGGNKGNGLLALAEYLGIQRDQIMACGDSDNDYSMIKAAGLGIAMENGLETIKKIAVAVTLSNDQDGVAYAIEQWVLTE
jgi:Cof subfamily protein (haloacid dehalogenase superfamily)